MFDIESGSITGEIFMFAMLVVVLRLYGWKPLVSELKEHESTIRQAIENAEEIHFNIKEVQMTLHRHFLCVLLFGLIGASTVSLAQEAAPQKAKDEQSAVEKIKAAKRLLTDAKGELTRQGKYNCCTEVPCNQCALDHQSCPCYDDLKAGKAVCAECYGGWQRGEGRDKKIKSSEVKVKFGEHRH